MEKFFSKFAFLEFLSTPLTSWDGWTLFYFVIFIVAFLIVCKYVIYFASLLIVSLYTALLLALKTLTNPNDNMLLAVLKTPFVFVSGVILGVFASLLGAFIYTFGLNLPQTQRTETQR